VNVALGIPFRYSEDDASLHAGLRTQGGYVALCNDMDEIDLRYGGWGTWAAEISVEVAARRLREADEARPICRTCLARLQDLRDPVTRLGELS